MTDEKGSTAGVPGLRRPALSGGRSPVERAVAIASPIVLLVLWEIAARVGLIDTRILPAPTTVLGTIVDLAQHGTLLFDAEQTIERFLIGMAVGVVPGVFLGLSMGLFRWVGVILNPIFAAFYNVPRIALFPLVLIFVGLNNTSNIVMIALGPFFTMLITSMGAATNIEPIYRDVARNFHARPRHLYFMVTLPAIAPALIDGLRLSVGLGLLGTIAVEFLVADNGIGHLIWNSWQVLSLGQSMAGLVVAALIGYVFYGSLSLLERLAIPWQRRTSFT
jgi:ABC-type nitrate/sulfonate/bicarbonate transport system permease component